MSRSRKHTPKGGIASADSEAKDKRLAHKCLRSATRQAIQRDDDVMPELREVSDIWGFAKDGKRWRGDADDMRK